MYKHTSLNLKQEDLEEIENLNKIARIRYPIVGIFRAGLEYLLKKEKGKANEK